MVLGFHFGTLARTSEIPFACDYLGFKTAGNRNTMQWHPSLTHIRIIHCTAETSRPTEPSELLALTHPGSTFPAAKTWVKSAPARALSITNTYGQKKRKNLQAYVSHSWSWTRQGSHGDTFPHGFSPILTSYAPAKRLQLSSHTSGCLTQPHSPRLELLMAVPKLCLVQTVSVKFCLCLFVQISHSYFPIPAPPLLHPTVNCTMIFSLLHNQNQPLPFPQLLVSF